MMKNDSKSSEQKTIKKPEKLSDPKQTVQKESQNQEKAKSNKKEGKKQKVRNFKEYDIKQLAKNGYTVAVQYTSSQSEQDDKEAMEPCIMWQIDPETKEWHMIPKYVAFFNQLIKVIENCRATVYKKWENDQINAYNTYLDDIQSYINKYIFTGKLADFNLFYDVMEEYNSNTNPRGKQLFDHQIDYLAKKQDGYDFRLDKKNRKNQNRKQQKFTQSKKPIYVQKKEYAKKKRYVEK